MDFLDPKKKRAHRIRLFIGYGLMAIALGIATTVLVFEAYGFDLDRKTGEVIQNGLVFVDAHPEAAEVYLNGEQKGRTDTRLVIPGGSYEIELRRQGYRSWKRAFTLEGGKIERLVYPMLFPETLSPKDEQLYTVTPGMATQSPDRHWLLIQQPASLTTFDLIDISKEKPEIKPLSLAATLFNPAGAVHKLEMAEWSSDNRHVILKHTFETGYEFVMVDREDPAASFNVNTTFGVPITTATLRDKRFDQFYLYDNTGGIVRRADSRTKAITPILTNVTAFKSHGDDVILYTTSLDAPKDTVLVRVLSGNESFTVRELPVNSAHLLEIARYDGKWYIAAGAASDKKVYVYKDIFEVLKRSDTLKRLLVPVAVLKSDGTPQHVSFSANTRFIAMQSSSRLGVYDIETDKIYSYDTKLALAEGQKITWMDGHRFMVVSQDQVVVFDYDGINTQKLIAANSSFIPFFDRDYENLFTIAPSVSAPNRPALTGTPLKLEQ